eukprot:2400071-Prymnesium_polylepis.1
MVASCVGSAYTRATHPATPLVIWCVCGVCVCVCRGARGARGARRCLHCPQTTRTPHRTPIRYHVILTCERRELNDTERAGERLTILLQGQQAALGAHTPNTQHQQSEAKHRPNPTNRRNDVNP